jgi:hypothetical protein
MTASTDVQRRGAEFFISWKEKAHRFFLTEEDLDALVSIADHMIPADGAWPAPSATGVREYIQRGAARQADVSCLHAVAEAMKPVLGRSAAAVQDRLTALQCENPLSFRVLLEFVYYAYYAQPEVARVIRQVLDCDYISPPQPHGYALPADEGLAPSRAHRYVPTTEVRRLDLTGLDFSERAPRKNNA